MYLRWIFVIVFFSFTLDVKPSETGRDKFDDLHDECMVLQAFNDTENELVSHENYDGVSVPYPSPYRRCWIIVANRALVVRAYPQMLHVRDSPHCRVDYLLAVCGSKRADTKVGRFCGTEMMGFVYTSGNTLYLEFHSDDTASNETGFKISYMAIPPGRHNPSCLDEPGANSIVPLIIIELLLVVAMTILCIVMATLTYVTFRAMKRCKNCLKADQKEHFTINIQDTASIATNTSSLSYVWSRCPQQPEIQQPSSERYCRATTPGNYSKIQAVNSYSNNTRRNNDMDSVTHCLTSV